MTTLNLLQISPDRRSLLHTILRLFFSLAVVTIIVILIIALIWNSIFVYIHPGYMGIVNRKFGKPLAPGQILAQPGQKGVQEYVLGEGRHFLNPLLYSIEIRPCILIPAGKIGIVTSKVGTNRADRMVIVNEGEKGTWRRVLTPGLHRLNPYGYDVTVVDAAVITPGYVGFLTRLQGLPTTNAFAGPGEKGMLRTILQPGIYFINPVEYRVLAVEIGINQVTFAPPERERYAQSTIAHPDIAARLPSPSAAPHHELSPAQQQAETRQYLVRTSQMADWITGSFSARQKAETERIIRQNVAQQIAQQGVEVRATAPKDAPKPAPAAITFPSKDGFMISLDATIEWELLPDDVAEVMAEFGDVAAVEDKIIIPQSQSIGRLQGSTFLAKDFLLGDRREVFQEVFRQTLMEVARTKNIVIHSAFIRNIIIPDALLRPIRERYIAVEKEKTSRAWQATKRSAGDLQRERSLISQRTREIEARTEALVQLIRAEKERTVQQIAAQTRRLVAEKQAQIAQLDAQRTLTLGEANADVRRWLGEADAQGLQLKIAAIGSPEAYTRYQLAQRLPANLTINIVRTGEGTLWTDLEKTAGAAAAGTILRNSQTPSPQPAP
ncbi:MAG: SPFH domain-containing protein [bacterium]|nr:SPFH domain-containing protein [bacterium]